MSRLRTDTRIAARLAGWASAAAIWLLGTVAWAGQTPQQGFQPIADIPDAARETISASPLVYGAYGFVWIALVVYVFLLWQRLGKVERELADVTSRLAARR
jgi:CcmD family protein